MLRKMILAATAGIAGACAAVLPTAMAGQPTPWQLGLQPAATPVMEDMIGFHDILLWVITIITLFVLGLLVYVIVKFNAKANPTPSTNTHNTVIEVLWTVVPILILVGIAIPSFKLLYYQNTVPEADMTIKVVGHQWYWTYEYPEEGFEFDAFMVDEESLEPGQPRLLETDTEVVVPLGKTVRVQLTADDVLHAWAVPAFGVKVDTVPGKLNETWFQAFEPGVYYGQCSELCGTLHSFMPIKVRVVTQAEYDAWVIKAKAEYAQIDAPHTAEEQDLADAR